MQSWTHDQVLSPDSSHHARKLYYHGFRYLSTDHIFINCLSYFSDWFKQLLVLDQMADGIQGKKKNTNKEVVCLSYIAVLGCNTITRNVNPCVCDIFGYHFVNSLKKYWHFTVIVHNWLDLYWSFPSVALLRDTQTFCLAISSTA